MADVIKINAVKDVLSDKHRECETIKPSIRLKNEEGSEDIHYSVRYDGIPNEFKDIAQKELDETEENKRIGLLKLKDFLKRKVISGVEDDVLINVLRNCKYNIKKSEDKLMKFLQTQDMATKLLQTADMERLEAVLNHNIVGFLPYRDKHGRVIIFTNPYDFDLDLFDTDDAAICHLCMLLYILTFPLTSVSGIDYIGESKTQALSILFAVGKTWMRYIPTMLTLPFRFARIDIMNENFFVKWIVNIARYMVPAKILQRVKFYGNDLQGLQKFYNPILLPNEFGGTMGPLDCNFYKEDFFNFIRSLKSRTLFLQK